MKKLIKGFVSLVLVYASTNTSAAVVYEWQAGGTVQAYVSFKDSVASNNSYWSVLSGESFIDQVEGGYSGISVLFPDNAFYSPVSGDFTVINDFGSNNGTEMDFGYLSGSIEFADGSIWSDVTFNLTPVQDVLTFDGSVDGIGNPTVGYGYAVSSVPVPAAAWLFSSGLIGLVGMARRKHSI